MSRKPDPYYERCRELAIAAGKDPDERVVKPGSDKTMPLWCTFRDAARQEHLAREAEKVAETIAPQAPQYQDSPLKVFGDHDEGTLAQMRNCMKVGNVVGGVICADGHLGYAQPVGGLYCIREANQYFWRGLRHRLRQHGRAPRCAVYRY